MRKLFTVLATAIALLAASALMRAEAAPMGGLGDMSPITKGASSKRSAVGAAPIAAPAVAIGVPATVITAGAAPIAGATNRHAIAVRNDRQTLVALRP